SACHFCRHLFTCMLFRIYLIVSKGPLSLAAGAGASGMVAGALVGVVPSCSNLESLWVKFPFKDTFETKIRTINKVANVQVLLSKKSPVFFTPPIICEPPPPKEDDRPPPLGFCTMITSINKRQTMMIRTKNIENVFIVLLS